MPSLFRDAVDQLKDSLDQDLVASVVATASLGTRQIREDLGRAGLVWVDAAAGRTPDVDQVERSAEAVIRSAGRQAGIRGGLAGALGLIAIPPELLATVVHSLRLAQRLAVVYGHDPETDRGRVLVNRALAQAYDVVLPRQGHQGLRVRDVPHLLRRGAPGRPRPTSWIAQRMAARLVVTVGARVGRVVPGVGAGYGAWDARRLVQRQGQRMREVFRRSWDGAWLIDGPIEEAQEVEEVQA